ncbi:AI-2E family transporter [Sphingomonas sp. VNH70]|uniref:AI-2E family transporter n=1 Tax=Sphingomonas silueang TaxID=3156617 RepID=UPI0032B498FB
MDGGTRHGGVSIGQVARITLTVVAIVGAAWLLVSLVRLVMLVFAASVIAVLFSALARRICAATRMPRGLALALSVVLLLGTVAGIFYFFGAQLVAQFDTIREQIPPALAAIQRQLDSWGIGEPARELLSQGSSDVSSLMSRAGTYVLTFGSGLSDAVLVLVGAIFLAADPELYRRGLVKMFPRSVDDVAQHAVDDAAAGLRGWMKGEALAIVVVAVLTGGGLYALGVPAALGLGLIAGLMDIIPFVGPIIAGVPAVMLAFTQSPSTALWTIVLFLVVQQIQGNILQPIVQKHAVDVPPAVLLFSVIGMGILFGFVGVILAAPLTIVVFVLTQRIYVQHLLGREIKVATDEAKE